MPRNKNECEHCGKSTKGRVYCKDCLKTLGEKLTEQGYTDFVGSADLTMTPEKYDLEKDRLPPHRTRVVEDVQAQPSKLVRIFYKNKEPQVTTLNKPIATQVDIENCRAACNQNQSKEWAQRNVRILCEINRLRGLLQNRRVDNNSFALIQKHFPNIEAAARMFEQSEKDAQQMDTNIGRHPMDNRADDRVDPDSNPFCR